MQGLSSHGVVVLEFVDSWSLGVQVLVPTFPPDSILLKIVFVVVVVIVVILIVARTNNTISIATIIMTYLYGSFRKLGLLYLGVLIIRILLFRVLY